MERRAVLLISLTLISIVSFAHAYLKIVPERSGVEYMNPKYVNYGKFYVRKTGRGGKYVAHADFSIKETFGNNVTVYITSYEFLHNEYRLSFFQFDMKLCNLINNERFIGLAVRNAGLRCPVSGEYHLRNLTLDVPEVWNMKWVFPFERAKFQGVFKLGKTQETLGIIYMMLNIEQTQTSNPKT